MKAEVLLFFRSQFYRNESCKVGLAMILRCGMADGPAVEQLVSAHAARAQVLSTEAGAANSGRGSVSKKHKRHYCPHNLEVGFHGLELCLRGWHRGSLGGAYHR